MRNRGRIVKLDEHRLARWYASRGWPVGFIAEKLGVSPNTVRTWTTDLRASSTALAQLARRIANLPDEQRRDIVRMLIDQLA